ncbi:MAG: glycosyltransferase family 4 protein [Pseudomonadota bacterium]
MKINILIYRPQIGGGARVASIYARALIEAGHDVQVISLGKLRYSLATRLKRRLRRLPDPNASLDPGYYADQGIPYTQIDHQDALYADDIPDADITVATWWETAEWLAPLGPEKGVKVQLIQDHEAAMPYLDAARVEAVYRLPHRKIVVSQWLKDVMAERYGQSDCVLIENGVALSDFSAPPRDKQPTPTIGLLYSSAIRKNSGLAIAACARLREQFADLRVVAFGAGDLRDMPDFPSWIEYEQKPPHDRIVEIYASCDVWLFTSDSEGFGLPILEAFACRTPVVATRAGAAPQLASSRSGALVASSVDDVSAAAARLLSATQNDWRSISDGAYETAKTHDWPAAAALFEKTLQRFYDERSAATRAAE